MAPVGGHELASFSRALATTHEEWQIRQELRRLTKIPRIGVASKKKCVRCEIRTIRQLLGHRKLQTTLG